MSLRAVRRSVLAASSVLALGGALALAGTASAANLEPFVTSSYASAAGALTIGYNALYALQNNGTALTGTANPLATTAFTAEVPAADLTPNDVTTEMAVWNASAADAADLTTAWDYVATAGGAPTAYRSLTYAELIGSGLPLTAAATAFPGLAQLNTLATDDTTDYPNGLFSIDSDLAVSSSTTVTAPLSPAAYTMAITATSSMTGGYIVPSQYTLTIPTGYALNSVLAGVAVPPADEANPPTNDAIGTVTLDSPASEKFGLSSTDVVSGKVYLVGTVAAPFLEIWLANGIYDIGTINQLSVPLTISWGEASVGGTPDPLPFSSLTLSFPAKTAPVKPLSCSGLGAVSGTATDYAAAVALSDGDSSDGVTSAGATAGPVTLADTNTVVTDLCAPVGSKAKITGLKPKGKKPSKPILSLTLAGNGGNKFTSATITLPKGITDKGKKTVKVSFAATAKRSITVKGLKATAKEAKVKAKSVSVGVTVVYVRENGETGTTGTSSSAAVKTTL